MNFYPRSLPFSAVKNFRFFSLVAVMVFAGLPVAAQDHAPVAAGGSFITDQGVSLTGQVSAQDADGDPISYVILTAPVHGAIPSISGSGAFVYTPTPNFHGVDSFVFVARAGMADSAPIMVLLMVNASPAAESLTFTLLPSRTLIGRLRGSDPDGDSLVYAKFSGPASVDPDGRFTFVGTETGGSFQYTVSDGRMTSPPATVMIVPAADTVGYLADSLLPKVTRAFIPLDATAPQFLPVDVPVATSALDLAVDRANRRLYVLTADALKIYDIGLPAAPEPLKFAGSAPVIGTRIALSLDGRTLFIGATGRVTTMNLYPESVLQGNTSSVVAAYAYRRAFPFDHPDRSVAAMAVHPAGDRLFVVIAMTASDKKLPSPNDYGYITQLVISSDAKTIATKRPDPAFAPSINIRNLTSPKQVVAIGINSLTFSPDGNYALLAAVGNQTPRATPFGILPSSDEGTGGIVILDVRPADAGHPWVNYLGFIPTTENEEKTAELRQQVFAEGLKIVHPLVKIARSDYLTAVGQFEVAGASAPVSPFATPKAVSELLVADLVVNALQAAYADYGYMVAYASLYPHDMVGASSVAINHVGDFGVVTLQDTNNLGLLSLTPSTELSGYQAADGHRPDFFIKTGTGKTINGFTEAVAVVGGYRPSNPLYSSAYPQKATFTSDDSRLYIGMAGGLPTSNTTNKFGSATGAGLRTIRDAGNRTDFRPGYEMVGGSGTLVLKSPRFAATWPGFGSASDLLSDQTKAYNRWNSLKPFSGGIKQKLISTDVAHLTIPGQTTQYTAGVPDALDFGYLLPAAGIGYRLNQFGLVTDAGTFATKGVITAIEQLGLKWDQLYREYLVPNPQNASHTPNAQFPVTRPYFILGPLTRPGGGKLTNLLGEAMTYTQGTGLQASFPYFKVGSDDAHDFVTSNGAKRPMDNSSETDKDFDLDNTKALIKLLLAEPQVRKIELDPYLLFKIPELNGDPRVIPHGSRENKQSRRDLDNHLFVTFDLSVDLDIDSDNNGVIDQTPAERGLRNQPSSGGKLILPNYGDEDGDGIPNYADGYDKFAGQSTGYASTGFTPMTIRIPADLKMEGLQFRLAYSESDPAAVVRSATPPFTYSLPAGGGAFRVWAKDGNQARKMTQISAGGDYVAPNTVYSVESLFGTARIKTVYIEAVGLLRPGEKAEVDFELLLNGGPQSSIATLSDKVSVSPALGSLAVDNNRDGTIKLLSEGSSDLTSGEKPYRFWLNDDDDDGGDINGVDIPGAASPDGQQVKVQGTRDLVDFFPVFLDLKQLLTVLPPSASVKYKLKNADDGLRFVYTDLVRADAFKYLKDFATGNSLKEADAHWVLSTGYDLDPTWLGQVKDADKGVILVEGRNATDKPLVLSVEKADGTVIAEVKLELKIVPVETMFRHLNLHDRNLPGLVGAMPGGTAQPEAMGDPTGFPDNPNSDSRWLIFVHGFNVSGQGSRGWNAEMFKRTYWSGNKSRFVGVSWFGNPDQVLGAVSDYHLSVRNAMITAPVLAQEINALAGAADTKTLFAHSLGCGVISSAIADYGMTVGKVCFVDAALARECFDGRSPGTFTSENDGMTPAAWKAYDSKLYAANWFNLFDPANDSRGKLTWINRFSGASSVVYHFYSSTEDVLAEYTGELPTSFLLPGGVLWTGDHLGTFGWVYQEKGKGNRQDYLINVKTLTELTHLGSYYGGWGFNLTDPAAPTDPIYYFADGSVFGGGKRTPSTTVAGSTAPNWQVQFRRAPLFDPGYGPTSGTMRWIDPSVLRGPTWIPQLYDTTADTTTGNGIAAVAANRAQLLAEAIPSLTWCIGSHAVTRFEDRNFNLPTLVNQTNWPRGKPDGVTPEWRHSDMREVAYLYQYGVFDKIVALSEP